MATTDLLFSQSPSAELVFGDDAAPVVVPTQPVTTALVFSESAATGSPVSLVFGAEAPIDTTVTEFTLDGTLDQPALSILIVGGPITDYSIDGRLAQPPLTAAFDLRIVSTLDFFALLPDPPLVGDIEALYVTNTHRPTVGQTSNEWQTGSRTTQAGVAQGHQDSGSAPAGWAAFWSKTLGIGDTIVEGLPYALRPTPVNQDTRFEQGTPTRTATGFTHQDAHRTRTGSDGKFQDATPRRSDTLFRHQDGDRTKRATLGTHWQVATHLTQARGSSFQVATDHPVGWLARHQDAMRPPAGFSVVIVVPPQPDYTPNPHLLFECPPLAHPHLVFGAQVCYVDVPTGQHFSILPARFYMTTHNVFAERLPDLAPVPLYDATVSADAGSYCWTLQLSGPASLFELLAPVAGLPAQIRVTMDGIPWVFAVDGMQRAGAFGKTGVSVTGRSVTALIGAPYLRAVTRDNVGADRLAQQLALDALQYSGVDLDWGLTDWLVPAGAWSHQGTPLDAVQAIAQAAGGYLQSHRSAATLLTRHPYSQRTGDNPGAPWGWMTGPADVDLAPDAIITDGVERRGGPDINAVYVSGITQGVLAHVKRTGTAGDKLSAMVTDALITHADAARQRGLAVLGAAGSKYNVRLELPVLTGPSQPGVLEVGQLVQVNAASPWRGRVRAVSAAYKRPTLRQTVTLERHLETV